MQIYVFYSFIHSTCHTVDQIVGCALATNHVVAFMRAFQSFVLFTVRRELTLLPLERFLGDSA